MMPRDIDDRAGLSKDPNPEDTFALERALGYHDQEEEPDGDRLGSSESSDQGRGLDLTYDGDFDQDSDDDPLNDPGTTRLEDDDLEDEDDIEEWWED